MIFYVIAGLLFIVAMLLYLIKRRLDRVIELLGGRAVLIPDETAPPRQTESRHDKIIRKWRHGG